VGSLYHPQVKRKDGTIYEDPIWWAAFYLNGRLVRRSTKTEKKGVARRQLQHWEGNPREADPITGPMERSLSSRPRTA
jgi:hypothetical protein